MARNTKNTKNVDSLLLTALRETVEPLVKAIDAKPALLMEDSADTGHARPSTMDTGLKILLGQICQTLWRQQYGTIKTQRGSIPNNDERLKQSEVSFANLQKEIDEDKTTMESRHSVSLLHWFDVNENRFNVTGDLLSGFTTIYRETFDEDWKPIVDTDASQSSRMAASSRNVTADVSDAEKKRLVELSERLSKRVTRAA